MMKSEEEARQATIDVIDKLIDFHKKNISGLEIMKEHVNDMTTEQFKSFGAAFAFAISPELFTTTMKANSAIRATNDTIKQIKEEEE